MASVTNQFAEVSGDVLSILDSQLALFAGAPSSVVVESVSSKPRDRILFYKMKADTHRYLAELAPADPQERQLSSFPADNNVEADCALSAYKIATSLAETHLEPCAPLRLLLALNFSTFYCDVRSSLRMATSLGHGATRNELRRLQHDRNTFFISWVGSSTGVIFPMSTLHRHCAFLPTHLCTGCRNFTNTLSIRRLWTTRPSR